jgi:hypothetical protein
VLYCQHFVDDGGDEMSAKIIFQSIENRQNGRGQNYAYAKFEIVSLDGSLAGEIGVPSANDQTVLLETKRRLRDLLQDALADLDGVPLAAG